MAFRISAILVVVLAFGTSALAHEREGLLLPASSGVVWAQAPAVAAPARERENWAVRHPVLLGTLIGVGAGFAIQAATCGDDWNDGVWCWAGTAAMAGAGAYGGVVASAMHESRRGQPVSRRTKTALMVGGMAAGGATVFILTHTWGV